MWRAIVLPVLYACLTLRVPHQSTEYAALENLLSSSGEGLKFTKSIRVQTVQTFNAAYQDVVQTTPEGISTMSFPNDAWSDTMNALIRMLIMRIQRNNLESFTYVVCVSLLFPKYEVDRGHDPECLGFGRRGNIS